jgi:hypothetical protein
MAQNTVQPPQVELVPTLAKLRYEWQQAANGESLLDMDANVGLMLADIVNSLGLTPQEQARVLGKELLGELSAMLEIH